MFINKKHFTLLLVIASLLISIVAYMITYNQPNNSAEKVVRDFYKWRNEKNVEKMEETLIETRRGEISWDFVRLDYVKLISIEEDKYEANLKSFMDNGMGSHLQPYAVKCFKVDYEISYVGGFGSGEESGKHMMIFYVVKEKEDSSWLIADWGV